MTKRKLSLEELTQAYGGDGSQPSVVDRVIQTGLDIVSTFIYGHVMNDSMNDYSGNIPNNPMGDPY